MNIRYLGRFAIEGIFFPCYVCHRDPFHDLSTNVLSHPDALKS
jgi:hypothetical protein